MTLSYEKVGDTANMLSFLSAAVYAVAVAREWNKLDPVWKENGFCIANANKDYWTSHDLCFYFDSFVCGIMCVLYRKMRHASDGMADANKFLISNAVAHFIHGLAHGFIGKNMRDGFMSDPEVSHLDDMRGGALSPPRVILELFLFCVFWISFVRATMPRGPWKRIVAIAVVIVSMHLSVPRKFGFAFVQTALFVVSSANELLLPTTKKGFEYAVVPVVVGFPSTLVAWAEATMCTRGVMALGGHLTYDGFLGVGIAATYCICWYHQKTSASVIKKKVA